jgi:hypothetical protein
MLQAQGGKPIALARYLTKNVSIAEVLTYLFTDIGIGLCSVC